MNAKNFLYIGAAVICLYLVVLLFTQWFFPVKLVSSLPQINEENVALDAEITMDFSSSLPQNIAEKIKTNQPLLVKFAEIKIEKNRLIITPIPWLNATTSYLISINTGGGLNPFSRAIKGKIEFKTADALPPTPRPFKTIEDALEYEREGYLEVQSYQEKLEKANPLVKHLPYFNAEKRFEVHYGVKNYDTLEVFYPIILRPTLLLTDPEYQSEVDAIKQAALLWIGSRNINPNTLNIEWRVK